MKKARAAHTAQPLGRPKDSGSRQQTHPGQVVHTGSPRLDSRLTRRTSRSSKDGTDKAP